MISTAATPVAGRASGHASSSRLAHAAKALSSARSAAVSGGVVAMAVVLLAMSVVLLAMAVLLLVTGASDQRRRLRSAAEDIFFWCCSLAARVVSIAEMPWSSRRMTHVTLRDRCYLVSIDAIDASTRNAARVPSA